jgi:hypothetical protein
MALDPVTAALQIGGKLLDRFIPDPTQRASAQLELLRMQQAGELAQIAVNTEEARNPSLFVAGWRPALGWCCVMACGWNWIGLPVVRLAGELLAHPVTLAPADLSEMWPVLLGMLGLGTLRTVERINGKA